MAIDHQQFCSQASVDWENESIASSATGIAGESTASTMATAPIVHVPRPDDSDVEVFDKAKEKRRASLKMDAARRRKVRNDLTNKKRNLQSKINDKINQIFEERSLPTRSSKVIAELEAEKKELEHGMESINDEIKKVVEECVAYEPVIQARNPGKINSAEAQSLVARYDEEYIAALRAKMLAEPPAKLYDCVEKLQALLQRNMVNSKLETAVRVGSEEPETFKFSLRRHCKKIQAKGPWPFIRMYTGQSFPVYATVSSQMVNTKSRFVDSKLSKGVLDCMPWQKNLDLELAQLPKLGSKILYRGIDHQFDDLAEAYGELSQRMFYEPKSATTERDVAATEFAGSAGTLFVLQTYTAVDITHYSEYPGEKEALVRILTEFKVTRAFRGIRGSYDEIHMEEIVRERKDEVVSDKVDESKEVVDEQSW